MGGLMGGLVGEWVVPHPTTTGLPLPAAAPPPPPSSCGAAVPRAGGSALPPPWLSETLSHVLPAPLPDVLLLACCRHRCCCRAQEVADCLLPAYATPTGIPLGTINLASGAAKNPAWNLR